MALPVPDKQRTLAALDDASAKLLDLVADVPDSGQRVLGVWDVAELMCHLSQIFQLYPRVVRGEGSPMRDQRQSQQFWQEVVSADPERDLGVLCDRIVTALKDFKNSVDDRSWTEEVPWHGGVMSPISSLAGGLLNECEVHGWDVARAFNRRWSIDPDYARIIVDAHLPWLPYFVDPDVARSTELSVDMRIRGGSRFHLRLAQGKLKVDTDTSGKVDVHVSADPVAYLLVGYGRLSQQRAALTGKMLAWGRRPWRVLRLGSVFVAV